MRSLIVAMSENRVIGRNNKLPWYLPNDLKYFKRVTMGKPIIMGRKTFDSIGKPLLGRENIVVTRNADWLFDGVTSVESLEQAFKIAEANALFQDENEVVVIGGSQLYENALEFMDRLYLTEVHAQIEGDAFFPEVNLADWDEVERQNFKAEEPNPYDYSFVIYDRKKS
jgi:dihydrofolate reductase